MPLLLVAFSYFGQNVLVERYSFATVAALAPVAALLLAQLSRPWLVICVIALVALSSLELIYLAADFEKRDREVDELAVTIARDTGSEEVLFESPVQLYPLCRYARPLARRCHLLDFNEGEIGRVTNDRLFMRDLARRYAEFYPTPSLVKWADVRRRGQVFLVPHSFAGTYVGSAALSPYPGFRVEQMGRRLVLLVSDR
jgi:hypothetical protein